MKIAASFIALLTCCSSFAQSFVYPTSGNAAGHVLEAPDGVRMVATITSYGCPPTNGTGLTFSASHVSAGAIFRSTSWAANCRGSYEALKFDFSTGNTRPLGIRLKLSDVDNGSDSVSIEIFSAGQRLDYSYQLFANTFVSAHGALPRLGFVGSLQNNSGQDDDRGSVLVTSTDGTLRVDSIIIYKHNGRDISGSPSQSFSAFEWTSTIVLPATIRHFEMAPDASGLRFRWRVAEESGGETYEVQASEKGSAFVPAGPGLPADRRSGAQKTYEAVLKAGPLASYRYFRLAVHTPGGPTRYSRILRYRPPGETPLISTDGRTLTLRLPDGEGGRVGIRITDLAGRAMLSQTLFLHPHSAGAAADLSALPARAFYLISVRLPDGRTFTQQFFKE